MSVLPFPAPRQTPTRLFRGRSSPSLSRTPSPARFHCVRFFGVPFGVSCRRGLETPDAGRHAATSAAAASATRATRRPWPGSRESGVPSPRTIRSPTGADLDVRERVSVTLSTASPSRSRHQIPRQDRTGSSSGRGTRSPCRGHVVDVLGRTVGGVEERDAVVEGRTVRHQVVSHGVSPVGRAGPTGSSRGTARPAGPLSTDGCNPPDAPGSYYTCDHVRCDGNPG